jgi:hypothetical protein
MTRFFIAVILVALCAGAAKGQPAGGEIQSFPAAPLRG